MPVPPRPVVAALTGARRLLRAAEQALLPPEVAALDLLSGVSVTHLVAALVDLGVADALAAGPLAVPDLAGRVGADPAALDRLLRAAAAYRLCRYDRRGRVRVARLGQVLRADHPASVAGMARYLSSPAVGRAWAGLAEAVRSGEPAFPKAHGMSVWQWLALHPREQSDFGAAMHMLTTATAEMVAAAYPWPRGAVVCDVGGGTGAQLAALLCRRRDLVGVLLDSPGMVAQARGRLEGFAAAGRCGFVAADLFAPWQADADVYVLKEVLHAWDDERCGVILARLAAAAPRGALVVLVEVTEQPGRPNHTVPLVDLQMLTQSDGGRQRSAGELRALLSAHGFTPAGVRKASVHTLVLGRRG